MNRVETHTIDGGETLLNIPVSDRTADQVVFEDFTCNHNKTMIQVRSTVLPGEPFAVPLTITISTRHCPRKIIEEIPAGATRAFQVEDFQLLTVSNPYSNAGQLDTLIQKTFCICCGDKKKCEKFHSQDKCEIKGTSKRVRKRPSRKKSVQGEL